MEIKHLSLIFLLGVNFSVWLESSAEINFEDNFNYLTQKIKEIEAKMLSEKKETADLILGVLGNLLATIQENETKSEEAKRQLWAKIEEIENESRNKSDDVSTKLRELRQFTVDHRDVVLKRVTEVDMRWEESTTDVAWKLENAERKFTKIDNSLLVEVLELKTKLHEAEKRIQEFAVAFEREVSRNDALEAKVSEITSQLASADGIRESMSTLADDLRLTLDESLISGLENMQSNLTAKVRVLEKECANISHVSMLRESLKNLEMNTKEELESLQSEMSPRIELLEEKSALCNDVPEMIETLGIHSSELSRLNQLEMDFHKTCDDEPPPISNGKTLYFERKPGSIVRYECDRDFFMTRNSTVKCSSGKWVGSPPVCRFYDTSFTAVTYVWYNITCYSDENFQKIQFSRVHDTGRGEELPTEAKTTVGEKWAALELYELPFEEKYGLYKCGFEENNKSAAAVVPFQYQYADIYFMHSTQVANAGDTIELKVIATGDRLKLRWKHNGEPVPFWDGMMTVTIANVTPADAGIYECNHDGTRALMRLIVRKCGKDTYGDNCDKTCPSCFNGGICHDDLGICVCPPGFTGYSCEVACGENRFGADCSQSCLKSNCRFHIFCKSDPYGCSCAPGFTGYSCYKECDKGWYGADCKKRCHCANGPTSCNKYTGVCSGGCSPGWTGPSCQIEDHEISSFFKKRPDEHKE